MARQRRHDDTLKTRMDAVDAQLAQLLDVRPSDEFEARVRQRVQDAPARPSWGWAWRLAGAAAVIAGIVFAFVARTPDSPDVRAGMPASPDVVAETPVAPPVGGALAAAPRLGPSATERPQGQDGGQAPPVRTRSQAVSARIQPAVIVDQGQRAALDQMMQLVQQGKLDSKMLETPPPTTLPLEANVEVAPLTVQPLEVLPIPGARTDQK